MSRFIKKIFLFSLPLIFIVTLYFILDPFKVLYNYDSFFNKKVEGTVFLNTDYVATANFENRNSNYEYTSFIFGNSRAWFYRIAEWKKYIGNEPAYHFDAAGETLYALHKKILYLDKKEVEIKNALIILDYGILSGIEPKTGHLGIISPQLVGNKNWLDFHMASVNGFLNVQFMYAYLDFKITGKLKPYMHRNHLIESRPFTYNPVTNELSFDYYESLINKNKYYTKEKKQEFYERSETEIFSPPTIGQIQEKMLEEIFYVFRKHDTRYRIIISPLYNQEHISNEDVTSLVLIFGGSNVYDFSGKNSITEKFSNYYETSHYRPPVAGKIMEQVYKHELQATSGRLFSQRK